MPRLESLEERLPPGDTVLAGLLANFLAEPHHRDQDVLSWAPEQAGNAARPAVQRQVHSDGLLGQESSPMRVVTVSSDGLVPSGSAQISGRGERVTSNQWNENDQPAWLAGTGGLPEVLGSRRSGRSYNLPLLAAATTGEHGPVSGVGFVSRHVTGNDVGTTQALPELVAGNGAVHGLLNQHFVNFQTAPVAMDSESEDAPAANLESGIGADPRSLGVHALFNLTKPTTGPFPSNVFTVPDETQNTGRRVNMPKPDCNTNPSDCEDLDVINTLDGFNIQPRLSIPFDGPIDVKTATSKNVFLISLGDTLPGGDKGGQVVGINQIVWDPPSNTLHVESDELLDQHTKYALIVTNGIHDTTGKSVEATDAFRNFRKELKGDLKFYKKELQAAIKAAKKLGINEKQIVTASVFTTQSVTAVLEKMRDQIHADTPAPADFLLGSDGTRTVFPLDQVKGITFHRHIGVDPDQFDTVPVDVDALRIIPGVLGRVAFGTFLSPDYELHPGEYIPPVATLTGTPVVQGINELYFNLFLPSGPKPVGGWPVVIYVHGANNNKQTHVLNSAASMAAHGLATIAINSVGHGFGPLSTLTVNRTVGESVTFSAGGRSIDQDGDHVIGAGEGARAYTPQGIIETRDGFRQTVVDLMQLVRVIEVGIDVDGNGSLDLDPSRIYYLGRSFGGQLGTSFLAVEPDVRAGVLHAAPWSHPAADRLTTAGRPFEGGKRLALRVPSLVNDPGIAILDGLPMGTPVYHDNTPLRNNVPLSVMLSDGTSQVIQSPVINTVAGAMEIQAWHENTAWVQSGGAGGYAPHLRKNPLPGVPPKSVLIQFSKGDQVAANPVETALIRAGDLADRTTYYRNDLAFADDSRIPKDPHRFLEDIHNPLLSAIALEAQNQIATFFASDGTVIIQPEPKKYFEVPIQGPLPEDLNYIP